MKQLRTNLRRLKPSRRAPVAGDIFTFRPKNHPYYFGRVISLDADIGGFPGILVYLYSACSDEAQAIPAVSRNRLLVPPLITNRLPWTRGYFMTLMNAPLAPRDVFPVHTFSNDLPPYFVDEKGRPVQQPQPPIGEYGLHSYRTIDDAVSDALSIPRVPDK